MIKIKRDSAGKYRYGELWADESLISSREGFTRWEDILQFLSDVSEALGKPVSVTQLPYVYED